MEGAGRPSDRTFWVAITGTRAMIHWGMPLESVDVDNIVVDEWHALIDRAAG